MGNSGGGVEAITSEHFLGQRFDIEHLGLLFMNHFRTKVLQKPLKGLISNY